VIVAGPSCLFARCCWRRKQSLWSE
jgi:hypothetical protein